VAWGGEIVERGGGENKETRMGGWVGTGELRGGGVDEATDEG